MRLGDEMVFGLFSGARNGSQAALVEAELENLTSWAQRKWPLHWQRRLQTAHLKEALDAFICDGFEHAQCEPLFQRQQNAVLARALLIGIGRSDTHPLHELESALGVTFPPEAHK